MSGRIEDLAEPNTMMVFESQVERLKVKVGDAVTLSAQTNRGAANTVDCRIVAIAKDMGLMSKFGIFVPDRDHARALPAAPGHHGRHPALSEAEVRARRDGDRRAAARHAGKGRLHA